MTRGRVATPGTAPTRHEVVTVGGGFLLYGSVFFDRLAPLYLVALIAGDLGVPSAREGTLALAVGLGWAAAMPIVRATSGRGSDRTRILIAAIGAGAFSIASALAPGWALFVLLRGFGGLAAASGSPAMTSLVFATAPVHRRGLDLGIVQSSTRVLGSLVSPVVVTAVAATAGWRAAMVVSGALLLAAAVAMWLLVPGESRTTRAATMTTTTLHPGGYRNLLLSVVGCVVLLAWLTIWSQASVGLLREWLDLDPAAAGRLVGLFGFGAAAASLLLPLSSDRIGRRSALAIAGLAGGLGGLGLALPAVFDLVPPRGLLIAALLLAGVAMGGLPLTISIIPAETVAAGDIGRALTGPIAGGEILGASVLPLFAAALAATHGRPIVLAVAATAVLALVAISVLLRPLDLDVDHLSTSDERGA